MKKIGILFGQENTFPQAFIERVNSKNIKGIMAEAVSIDKVKQGEATDYAVIIDRISQDVPFYRAYLKNAAIGGTAVINNPFWWSADEKFFNNALAQKVGVAVPNTVILPSHERPTDTDENSFRNLKFPIDWHGIFTYVGFPAYMKPHSGGGWKSVYRIENAEDLFNKHRETGQLVMMLQEEIVFTEYFRCYYLGGDRVHIMQYEPRNPHHLRYVRDGQPVAQAILDKVRDGVIKLNRALGYDFNTVEFAVRDGVPYAIDFCNPAPDADINSVGEDNFEWIVENAAQMAIEKAQAHKSGQMNLTWGTFVADQFTGSKTQRGRTPGSKASGTKQAAVSKSAPKKAAKTTAKASTNAAPKAASQKEKTAKKVRTAPVLAPKPAVSKAKATAEKQAEKPKTPGTSAKPTAAPKAARRKSAAPKATAAKTKTVAAPKSKPATKTTKTASKTTAPKRLSKLNIKAKEVDAPKLAGEQEKVKAAPAKKVSSTRAKATAPKKGPVKKAATKTVAKKTSSAKAKSPGTETEAVE